MAGEDDLGMRADRLGEQVEQLNVTVERLGLRVQQQARRGVRAVYAVILLFLLLGVMAILLVQQYRTSDRLESVVQRSLCPVYALVVGSYDPNTRPAGEARDKYDATFKIMRDSYAELQCTSPLVPPRSTS